VDTQRLNHLQIRGLGGFEDTLGGFVRSIAARMLDALHLAEPAVEPREFDLIAYRDGDYFRAHIDTTEFTDTLFRGHAARFRRLTAALRLVAFPSWLRHEVLPVHVPSGAWRDSRFAINCWLHRARQAAGTPP